MKVSTYMNGDKKAVVEKSEIGGYVVNYYLNNKVLKKENVNDMNTAEDLAEEYVLAENDNGPSLLNEDA